MEILNLALGLMEMVTMVYCSYYFLSHFDRTIYRKKRYYILGFGCYVVSVMIGPLWNGTVSLVMGLMLLPVIGYLLFHKSVKYAFYCFFYGIVTSFVMMGTIRIVSIFVMADDIYGALLMGNISIGLKIIANLFVTRFLVYFLRRKNIKKVTGWQMFSMYLVPLWSMFFLLSLLRISYVYIQLYDLGLIAFNVVLLIALNFYFLYLTGYMSKANELETELKLYHQQNELQYKYYEGLEKKYQDSRKIIHDIKNHLQSVERLYHVQDSADGDAYVKDMYQMLNTLGQEYYIDNKMLNIILNDKLQTAKRNQIETSVRIGDVSLGFMKNVDITTIFANLLDNAIEASARVKGNPYIKIKMDYFNEFIVISIRNSSTETAKGISVNGGDGGKGRESRLGHRGFGLQNVKKTLEKYNGTIQAVRVNGEFQANITLPKPDGSSGEGGLEQ